MRPEEGPKRLPKLWARHRLDALTAQLSVQAQRISALEHAIEEHKERLKKLEHQE